MAGPIKIAILANATQAKAELNSTASTAEKIGGKFSKMRGPALAAAGGLALLGKAAIKSASDAQQSVGATETVFGRYASTVIRTSDKAAQQYGLSANSYRENANLIGSLFKNQGVSLDQLAGKTDKMIGTAADLSATFGGTTKEAVEALGSAFKGEFDPLEKYGISLKQSTISAELARRGEDKLTGAALAAAKQRATTALITKQAGGALGAFGREANTLAGQQQRLSATWENAKAKLGTALLPVLTQAAGMFTKLATAMADNPGKVQAVAGAIGALAAVILIASVAQKVYNAGLIIFKGIALAMRAATIVWANAQLALNLAMMLNPIGLVVIAIVALIAIFALAWARSEKFRSIVIGTWNAIKAAAVAVFNFLKGFISAVWGAIKTVITTYVKVYVAVVKAAWNAIKAVTSAVWNAIKAVVTNVIRGVVVVVRTSVNIAKTVVSAAWNFIKGATTRIWNGIKAAVRTAVGGLMDIVRGIKGKVTGFFSGAASWLTGAGKKIIGGLISGIKNMFGSVRDTLGSLTSKLTSWKGPPKRDAKLLTPAGELIMESLIAGFDSKTPAVRKALETLSRDIETFSASPTATLSLDAAQSAAAASRGDRGGDRYLHLSAEALSSLQRGRQVRADLDEWDSVGGRRRG